VKSSRVIFCIPYSVRIQYWYSNRGSGASAVRRESDLFARVPGVGARGRRARGRASAITHPCLLLSSLSSLFHLGTAVQVHTVRSVLYRYRYYRYLKNHREYQYTLYQPREYAGWILEPCHYAHEFRNAQNRGLCPKIMLALSADPNGVLDLVLDLDLASIGVCGFIIIHMVPSDPDCGLSR